MPGLGGAEMSSFLFLDETDPQDSEAEPEAAAVEEKTEEEEEEVDTAAPAAAMSEHEEESMETAVQGPSLPPYVQKTAEPVPAKEEAPSVPADSLYCISEPTPDLDPVAEKEPEVSGKGSGTRKPYLGPTADYLSSTKEEGPVVSMPPPRHVAKVGFNRECRHTIASDKRSPEFTDIPVNLQIGGKVLLIFKAMPPEVTVYYVHIILYCQFLVVHSTSTLASCMPVNLNSNCPP